MVRCIIAKIASSIFCRGICVLPQQLPNDEINFEGCCLYNVHMSSQIPRSELYSACTFYRVQMRASSVHWYKLHAGRVLLLQEYTRATYVALAKHARTLFQYNTLSYMLFWSFPLISIQSSFGSQKMVAISHFPINLH